MIYTRYLWHFERMLMERYDASTTIKHKGERGRHREEGLSMFLKENLPEAYGVGTGEIIPASGDTPSPQCDIVIYDRMHYPIIGRNTVVQQVPLEATYCVIEVKSVINSAALQDAVHKFRAIDALPRCEPVTALAKGKRRGPDYYLFGYRLGTSADACVKLVDEWPKRGNFAIFALDTGGTILVGDDDEYRTVFVTGSGSRQSDGRRFHYTLALFFMDILTTLHEIELGTVRFLDLIGVDAVEP